MQLQPQNKDRFKIKKNSVAKLLKSFDEKFKIVIFIGADEQIGSGAFGKCYLGINRAECDTLTNRHSIVVIKEIKKDKRVNSQELLYTRQIETLVKATTDQRFNKNLVKCYPFTYSSQKHYYMVMEYCQNKSLDRLINNRISLGKWFNLFQILKIFCDMVNGIESLKRHTIIHEDIKPANIFIKDKNFKLGDFGLAFIYGKNDNFIGRGGTMAYNALEKYIDSKNVDHRTDIYALGIVMYKLLYGSHPYYEEAEWKHYKNIQIQRLVDQQQNLLSSNQSKRQRKNFKNQAKKTLQYSEKQIFIKFLSSRKLKVKALAVQANNCNFLESKEEEKLLTGFRNLVQKMIERNIEDRANFKILQNFVRDFALKEMIYSFDKYSNEQQITKAMFPELNEGFFSEIQLPYKFQDLQNDVYFQQQQEIIARQAIIQSSIIIRGSELMENFNSKTVQKIKQQSQYINQYTRVIMQIKKCLTELNLSQIYFGNNNQQQQENNEFKDYNERKLQLEFVIEKYIYSLLIHFQAEMDKLILTLNIDQYKQYYRNNIDRLTSIITHNKKYLEDQLFITQDEFSIEQNDKDIRSTITSYLQELKFLDNQNQYLTWYFIGILKFVENISNYFKSGQLTPECKQGLNNIIEEWKQVKVLIWNKKPLNIKGIQEFIKSKDIDIVIIES